ncbi:MAG: aminopeptidase N [Bdellovibrionota bacterium]|nr:aminopeptidase N [Bdellovibrionota bacterium]
MAQKILLKDYTQPDFWAEEVNLRVDIYDDYTIVENTTEYIKNENTEGFNLYLNGQDLELLEAKINKNTVEVSHNADGDISFSELESKFTLYTKVKIYPEKNLTGEGFYRSGDIYCTQCEAQGFRRITFHQDRPDVMSSYTVTLVGDKERFPFLLSNGDRIDSGSLDDKRHFATWKDPHKKPSYLFAMVAGDLELVKGEYTTMSGRKVSLEFFVDKGNGDKCDHAIESLKNAMKWDEDRFGLEYDLDTYMVVAVDAFNMGAMENKGLNIFNSAYVLAKAETATDSDFQGIEGVIGHEYFHNWTGNRVTCRDWFQLTLKEGLTVFRDQEFSSDMNSRAVKRIDDVKGLKAHQYPEDASPLSHPIKPKEYYEINNFYTATVYEKGSEVIRMIHTLIGEENFRKGMDLYFERFDGMAVTTEDFVKAMADASGKDLSRFRNWYDQNGTPKVNISTNFKGGKLHVLFTHETKFNNKDSSLCFPFHFSLYSSEGEVLYKDHNFVIDQNPQSITIDNLPENPIASWNEGFSAPVKFETNYSFKDLAMLMAKCEDNYNRYEFSQLAILKQTDDLVNQAKRGETLKCNEQFMEAFKALLVNEALDPALKAYAISLPSLKEYNDGKDRFDFDHAPKAIKFLKSHLAQTFEDELLTLAQKSHSTGAFKLDGESMGYRAIKHQCLSILSSSDSAKAWDFISEVYENANNMTDEIGALKLLAITENPRRSKALDKFYQKWKGETLVMQKWLSVQALAEDASFETIESLAQLEIYDNKVPNLLRSLIGVYLVHNVTKLHQEDGSGYRFACEKIAEVDKFNPQIAARLAKSLAVIKKLDAGRAELLTRALEELKASPGLSKDTLEVVSNNLSV